MMTKEEIIRIATGLRTDFKCESDTMVDFCNSIIRELKEKSDWIPVSEDLPPLTESAIDLSDDVFVTDGDDTYIGYLVRNKGKTSWHIYEDVKDANVNIIAWMPLPKKYEPYERSDKK